MNNGTMMNKIQCWYIRFLLWLEGFGDEEYIEPEKPKQLLVNRIKTKDGTIIESRGRHDYVTHIDTVDGKEYMVDGGMSYCRRSLIGEDMCLYEGDPHEEIREAFSWGSYGVDGTEPLHYIVLKDMEDDHIVNILRTQAHISQAIRDVFISEGEWRENNA